MRRPFTRPPQGWSRRVGFNDLPNRLKEYDRQIKALGRPIEFTHDLLVLDRSTGGHSGQRLAYLCGEAAYVEKLKLSNGSILHFGYFWTGNPESARYSLIPDVFVIERKKKRR